jgi:protein-S-isoprenylcysteine O-methyltransferase Ste14
LNTSSSPTVGEKTCGLVCYLLGLAGAGALGGRVLLLGQNLLSPLFPLRQTWWLNLGWLAVFCLQHSGMARTTFKRSLGQVLSPRLERSTYVALSGLVLLGMSLTWEPVEGAPLWTLPPWCIVIPSAAGLGLVWVNLQFDHAGLFGVRQVWERAPTPEELLIQGPYRYVRHPLMACLLVVLWAQPVMTPTLLLLSGGLSGYLVVGLILEERDLLRRFGPAYAAYRRSVPALVPWRRPAAAATFPAVSQDLARSNDALS